MNNRTLCLSALIAVFFALTLSASAQRDSVQSNYKEYQRLFLIGKEPDFSTDASWRRKYEKCGWAEEAKDGNTEAQTLTAIWNVMFIDQQLNVEIERIVLSNPMVSNILASGVFLDNLSHFFRRFPEVSEAIQREGNDFDLYRVGLSSDAVAYIRNTDKLLRAKITGSIPQKLRVENKRMLAMFQTRSPEETPAAQWADTYYYMRERFDLLQELHKSFYHNFDEEQIKKILETRRNEFFTDQNKERYKAKIIAEAAQQVKIKSEQTETHIEQNNTAGDSALGHYKNTDIDSTTRQAVEYYSPAELVNMAKEDINEYVRHTMENEFQSGEKELYRRAALHRVHRYLIDVYQDFDYHFDMMKRIENYLRDGANADNIIAMFHYGLFLRYFGDMLGDERYQQKAQEWFDKTAKAAAALSDPNQKMKKRMEDTAKQFAVQDAEKDQREQKKKEKIKKLFDMEEEKIKTVDAALLNAAKRGSK